MFRRYWKYVLTEPFRFDYLQHVVRVVDEDVVFSSPAGTPLGCISRHGFIEIHPGYSWDGCSPKYVLLGLFVLGTPDGPPDPITGVPATYYASLVHDFLMQFAYHSQMPFTVAEIDKIFKAILDRDGFELSGTYHLAVRGYHRARRMG